MKKIKFYILLIISFLGYSQEEKGSGISDTIFIQTDTTVIKEYVIEEVLITDETSKLTKEEREQIKLLQKRVRVVFPYAKITADKLIQINKTMGKLKTDKEKKRYMKIVEKYLNDEFEPKLKKLSQKQGQILIKLIHRQTGITTFDLVKDYKSGWKAFWSNRTAHLFNMDLKKKYDPMSVPEDYYIEIYLQECFDEGKLPRQDAKKPITESELRANWLVKNSQKKLEE